MNAYLSVWRLRFVTGLQYRAAAWAGIATQFTFGFVLIMVYAAFYRHSAVEPPMSLAQVVSYVWLQQAFLGLIALWFRDQDLFRLIVSGDIAYELCRPCGLYSFWYAKLTGTRLSRTVLRCFPLLMIAGFLPPSYRLHPPPSAASLFLFIAALAIGMLMVVALSMLIHISVFWTMSPAGSVLLFGITGEFLSGMIVPIPMMPAWLQRAVDWLPFRWTVDFPFRVYTGHIPPGEAVWGIGVQLIWFALLAAAGQWCLRRALRRVVVQGG